MNFYVTMGLIFIGGMFVSALVRWLFGFIVKKLSTEVEDSERSQLQSHIEDLKKALADKNDVLNVKISESLDMKERVMELERDLDKEKSKFANLLHQKKSSEVHVGLIGEQLAPFLDAWPYRDSNFRFLGSPIDGVSFEDDEVVLVEIKTGNAKLSPRQRLIRKLVREGKVRFMEFRIEEDGYRCRKD